MSKEEARQVQRSLKWKDLMIIILGQSLSWNEAYLGKS
jgi:hypothetical protein